MRFNFLTPYPSKPGTFPTGMKDLNIERMLRYFVPDSNDLKYMFSILSQLETNKENILYRQQIIKDLLQFPEIGECLFTHLPRLKSDYKEYDDLKDRSLKLTYSLSSCDENQLTVILTHFIKLLLNLMNTYQQFKFIFMNTPVKSQGLNELKEFVGLKVNHPAFNELVELLNKLILNKSIHVQVLVHLNEQLHIKDCHLLESTALPVRERFFKKQESPVRIDDHNTTFSTIYKQSLMNIIEIISQIYYEYYQPFHLIKEDIQFYQFAIKYYELLKELNLPICLPIIKDPEQHELQCFDLADPLIAISAYKGSHSRMTVIPNTIKLFNQTSGVLIKGENNTGKSVFLRSIGIAIVFAQAGLFVCANDAIISIRTKLFTLFSSKEDPQQLGGRFEKEVQFFSQIIHQSDAYSCLLINEIFQSTSVLEAENALIDILNHLSKCKTLWVFVTHLTGLFERKIELGSIRGLETVYNQEEKYKFKTLF